LGFNYKPKELAIKSSTLDPPLAIITIIVPPIAANKEFLANLSLDGSPEVVKNKTPVTTHIITTIHSPTIMTCPAIAAAMLAKVAAKATVGRPIDNSAKVKNNAFLFIFLKF